MSRQQRTAECVTNSTMIKVVLVGDTGVGKTSIAQRLVCEEYSDTHIPTIGTSFFDLTVNGRPVSLWDTAGQEQFAAVTISYLRNVAIALVVYDMSQPVTADGATKWANRVLDFSPDARVVVVGNKKDIALSDVSYSPGLSVPYIEVSAKTGYGIADLHYLLSDIVSSAKEIQTPSLSPEFSGSGKGQCC